MSEANRTQLSFIEESTFGTTPAAGDFKKVPYTGAPDFSFNPSTVVSNEIRSDRQIDDLSLVGIEAGGSIEFEMSYGRFDDFLRSALYSSWAELPDGSEHIMQINLGELAFDSAANIPDAFQPQALLLLENAGQTQKLFTVGATTGTDVSVAGVAILNAANKSDDFVAKIVGVRLTTANLTITTASKTIEVAEAAVVTATDEITLEQGDWIAIDNHLPANQGFYRVVSKSSSGTTLTIVYDEFIANSDFSTGPGSAHSHIFYCRSVKNGVSRTSFSILQDFQSLSDPVKQAVFTGCVPGSFALTFDTQAILTGSAAFQALNSRFIAVAIAANRIKEQVLEKILNSSDNIGEILISGSKVASPNHIQSAGLTIENNLRRQNAVGSVGSVGIAAGRSTVTGSLSTYFGSKALAEDVINNAEKSLALIATDKENRRMLFDIPRFKFTSGSPGIAGPDTDIVLPLEFQALRDPDLNYQLKVCSFPYI